MPEASSDRSGPKTSPAMIDETNALPPGTRFGDMEILRTIGVGGFGIVYLARDYALEREVAIKEYMPGQLAQRGQGSVVSVRSISLKETFDIGRRSFVNEARMLARFDHRSLLKVYQFWEANGTAYMAMPYLRGATLKDLRQSISLGQKPPLDEAHILHLILPVLDALGFLHEASVFHRDISPDNILLPEGGGDPILLDFGAARRAITDSTQSFTTILKPSYAPIEQYAQSTTLRQGPWTDIYALGAVVHYLLLGYAPAPSTTRTLHDEHPPLASQHLAGCSRGFLAAFDWALAVSPLHRPQSVAELRAVLMGESPLPVARGRAGDPNADTDFEHTEVLPRDSDFEKTQSAPLSSLGSRSQFLPPRTEAAMAKQAVVAPPVAAARPAVTAPVGTRTAKAATSSSPRTPDKAPPSRFARGVFLGSMVAMGGLVLLAVAAGAGWALRGNAQNPQGGPEAGPAMATMPPASIGPTGLVASSPAAGPVSTPSAPSPLASASGLAPAPAAGGSTPLALLSPTSPASTAPGAGQRPAGPVVAALAGSAAKPAASRTGPADSKRTTSAALPPVSSGITMKTEPIPNPIVEEHAPAPKPPVVAEKLVPAGPEDPVKACAREEGDDPVKKIGNFFVKTWCVDRLCEKPTYYDHFECKKLRDLRIQR